MVRATKIDPERRYTLQDIVERRIFPRTSIAAVRKIVLADRKGKNVLRTIVMGDGFNTRYQIKGENLIKFVKAVEAGTVRL